VQIRASGDSRWTALNGPPTRRDGQSAGLPRGARRFAVCLRKMASARPCNKNEIENTYLCNNCRRRVIKHQFFDRCCYFRVLASVGNHRCLLAGHVACSDADISIRRPTGTRSRRRCSVEAFAGQGHGAPFCRPPHRRVCIEQSLCRLRAHLPRGERRHRISASLNSISAYRLEPDEI
jgi:hypothetical protein